MLSGGSVILGVAAGYLKGEYEALGVDFEERQRDTDEAIDALRGLEPERRRHQGPSLPAHGTACCRARSSRRTADLDRRQQPACDPARGGEARLDRSDHRHRQRPIRTAAIESVEDLEARVAYAREHMRAVRRTQPLDICFAPIGLALSGRNAASPEQFAALSRRLADLGVTWQALGLPAKTRAEWCERVSAFGARYLPTAR